MRVYESNGPRMTGEIAAELARKLRPGDCVAFRGGLGAGKTAFTRGLALGLGIGAEQVSSPTFALLNVYQGGGNTLYHFDMYRIDGFESLCSTGFFDYLGDASGILAVEWSENIADELPCDAVFVTLIPTGEHSRRIVVEGGDRF